jgi:uncharacterized protein DUF1990
VPSFHGRVAIAARWPAGLLATGWSYLWRTTPMHRREVDGSWADDRPPEIPAGIPREGIQTPGDGVGTYLHRLYRARILGSRMDAAALIRHLSEDPNRVAPGTLAHFEKTKGEEGRMAVGDEWVVRMPGPWNGPVRVIEFTPEHFRFATLDGHLEAGQIRFEAARGDLLEFRIESWTRSGDRFSNLLYHHLRMSKEIQLHMWTSVLERVADLSGGRMTGGIEIRTQRVE